MRTWFVAGWGLFALVATQARADIAPPDAPPETCTLAMWESETAECLNCWGFKGYENRCANLLAPYCYTKVCQTRSYSWAEVLCRTRAADAPTLPSAIGQAIYSPYPAGSPGIADGGIDGGIEAIPAACAPYTPKMNTSPWTATNTSTQSATATQSSTGTPSSTGTTSATSTLTGVTTTATASQTRTTSGTATASSAKPPRSSWCSLTLGRSASRAPGWLALAGLAVALLVRARRSR